MPEAKTNGIEIMYEIFGDKTAPAIVLISGIGTQLTFWEPEFCQRLAGGKYQVIRFDHRDVGLSTKCSGSPDISALIPAWWAEERVKVPYTLDDMADDVVGLLDALNLKVAHVVGLSMGGMIAQNLAIRYPARLLTMTSIMSTTGSRHLPPGKPEATEGLFTPMPAEREAYIDQAVEILHSFAGTAYPFDATYARRRSAQSYDRCYYPAGFGRQFAAILASENREPALQKLNLPALVIHGSADPLIPIEHGLATARAIPHATLKIIDGLGHELPPDVWTTVLDAIHEHLERS